MIIDFRVRPPFRSFGRSFGVPEGDDDKRLDEFVAGCLNRGVTRAVVMGRTIDSKGNASAANMTNEDIVLMSRRHPDFFIGFGSVDTSDHASALETIDRLADRGFKGIAFDNPMGKPARTNDDSSLFPLYERIAKRDLVIAITASALVGKSISFSDPASVQRVAHAFPETPVVVPHACWPWTTQAVAAALHSALTRSSRLHLIPDVYMHTGAPGHRDYEDAMRWAAPADWIPHADPLYARFIYASSSPVQPVAEALDAFRGLGLPEVTARAVLHDNAVRVLRL